MQQNKTIKNILYLAILTTVVVFTWVASNVWYSLVTPTTPEDTNAYSTPITPNFDAQTLEQLGNRIEVPVDLSQSGDYVSNPGRQETSTPSADITVTPTPEELIQPTPEESIDESLSPTPEVTL